jgi:hypothetical protein
LPEESKINYTGPDWFLMLLASLSVDQQENFLLLLWRTWHLCNDVIFAWGTTMIEGSSTFLRSYRESLNGVVNKKSGVTMKGKEKIHDDTTHIREGTRQKAISKWKQPPLGWVKLNTDASFCPRTGMASMGIVVHDPNGHVLLTAWRWLRHCGTPELAEVDAYL